MRHDAFRIVVASATGKGRNYRPEWASVFGTLPGELAFTCVCAGCERSSCPVALGAVAAILARPGSVYRARGIDVSADVGAASL